MVVKTEDVIGAFNNAPITGKLVTPEDIIKQVEEKTSEKINDQIISLLHSESNSDKNKLSGMCEILALLGYDTQTMLGK